LKELENGKICARAMCVLSHHAIYQVPSVSNPFFPVADNTEVAAPDRFEENKSNVTCSSSSVQETASLPKIYLDLVVQNRTRVIFSTHRTLNKVVRIEKEKSKATNKQKKIIKKQSEGEDNSSSDDDEEEKDVCDQVLSGTINSIAVLQVVKFSKSTTNGIIDFETIHSTTLTKKNNTSSKKKDKPTPEENEMISPISPAAFVNKLEI
jgi:hypothetical protein